MVILFQHSVRLKDANTLTKVHNLEKDTYKGRKYVRICWCMNNSHMLYVYPMLTCVCKEMCTYTCQSCAFSGVHGIRAKNA